MPDVLAQGAHAELLGYWGGAAAHQYPGQYVHVRVFGVPGLIWADTWVPASSLAAFAR